MSNKILFIFEGDREKVVVNSLQRHIFNDRPVIECVFGAEVYQLYTQISNDPDLDIFKLIQKRDAGLDKYCRNDFAEIYLFLIMMHTHL
jgi:hypothetical protein